VRGFIALDKMQIPIGYITGFHYWICLIMFVVKFEKSANCVYVTSAITNLFQIYTFGMYNAIVLLVCLL